MARGTLLIICGGIEATHGIARAREMGLHVVVSDRDPNAPGMVMADDRIVASTYDAAGTARAALQFHRSVRPIDGVLSIGADVPVTVATVAEKLHLPGPSLETARLTADKFAMKERFSEFGVRIPWYARIASPEELDRVRAGRTETLVLKPVDSRGSRGVLRLTPDVPSDWAFAESVANSPSGSVMAEAYLEGPQISTESIIVDGSAWTPGFSDRNYEFLDRYAPFFIENGGDLPSHLGKTAWVQAHGLMVEAARAIGLTHGTLKGDIVFVDGIPHVIEVAPRLSGGYFCTLEIPLCTGVDFVGAAISLALGERPEPGSLDPQFIHPVCQRYVYADPGEVIALDGVETARALPGIAAVVPSVTIGDRIAVPKNTTARAAMILASGATREEAQARADHAVRSIRIRTRAETPEPAL